MTAALWLLSVISIILCCSAHEHEGKDIMNSTGIVLDYLKENPQDELKVEVVNGNRKNPNFEWPKWAFALIDIIKHPEKPENSQAILYRDNDVLIINDKFPKAKFHFLVLPRSTWIDTAADVVRTDIPIIEKMVDSANKWLAELKAKSTRAAASHFKMGFHGKPSMKQLHLHVISDDFDAPAMKHAKHYNTFTTRYFLEANEFIARVRQEGYYPINFYELAEIAGAIPVCHRCGRELNINWHKAKAHFTTCTGPQQSSAKASKEEKSEAMDPTEYNNNNNNKNNS